MMLGEGIDELNPYFDDEVFFTDHSVKRNIEVVTDTASKMVFVDTGFVRVPYVEMKSRFNAIAALRTPRPQSAIRQHFSPVTGSFCVQRP